MPQGEEITEHLDVLIVGASISGIGAAHHLQTACPDKRFAILDARASFGGTWLQHRYPGARSDSDMFTYGYRFKPWTKAPIATRAAILEYLGEVIDDDELEPRIRYRHRVLAASWSAADQRWLVRVRDEAQAADVLFSCDFLWMCAGYYQLDAGHTPQWPGMDLFQGRIVHPQTWPEDLDYAGKRVVVIGSGATAATLIPSMAEDCAHITMLQRSPTYYLARPNRNVLAETLRDLDTPAAWTHEIVRRAVLKEGRARVGQTAANPHGAKAMLLAGVRAELGDDVDMRHFTPRYAPGQQRIPFLPDGDLFQVIRSGKASIVTDEIERFEAGGVVTASGRTLAADIVITATGFDLNALGDVAFDIDGRPLDLGRQYTYRGFMSTEAPNLFYMLGYFSTSWTMRVDLVAEFVSRLLNHMETIAAGAVTPTLRDGDHDLQATTALPDAAPTYLKRAPALMPRRGDRDPWVFDGDFFVEREVLPGVDFAAEQALVFSPRPGRSASGGPRSERAPIAVGGT
ncbi:MAG: NAD(P)/FAD-dependent oxidoreductase [Phenylobacterium sp.]|nr:NAD(P)/FAD-dependent oxidoreductase [Phenylobacterium sp.]